MKNLLILLIVSVGLWYGYHRYTNPDSSLFGAAKKPPEPPRRLAAAGTYFLREYVSVKTPSGMAGVIPGQEVRRVYKDDLLPGKVQVSDGTMEFEVDRSQLTDDLDVAQALRQQDQAGQQRSASVLAAQKQREAQTKAALDKTRAENVDRANKAAATR
jgi:hypothetical protein